MRRTLAATVAILAVAAHASAEGKETVYHAPKDKVFAVALETIAKEWRIESSSKESGVISFRSGMSKFSWKGQDLSLLIMDADDGGTKVIANSERRGSQAVTWGEGGKLQKKAIKLIGERLAKDGLIPETEVPK